MSVEAITTGSCYDHAMALNCGLNNAISAVFAPWGEQHFHLQLL